MSVEEGGMGGEDYCEGGAGREEGGGIKNHVDELKKMIYKRGAW